MSSAANDKNGSATGCDVHQTTLAPDDDCDPEAAKTPRRRVSGRVRAFFAPLDPVTGVDGGWAWMCLLGCTMMHFLVGGYERSYGLIYLQLQRRFTSSATMAAWVGGTCTAMRFAGSPIATSLSSYYSARVVVFIGGVIIGGASVANSFATSVVYMLVSYGFVAGTGGSLVYSPGLVVIGQRFNKRRGLATGVATAGAGAGAFAFPPLLHYLFSEYGFMVGMLVLGVLMFGNCISALLYRPPPGQSRQKQQTPPLQETSSKHTENLQLSDIQPKPEGDTSPVQATPGRQVDAAATNEKPKKNWKQIFITIEKSLGFPMWKKPVFVLFALSQGLGLMSYPTVLMLLPALVTERGVSDVKAALLLSLIAIVNTVSCLVSGLIFSIPFVRRHAPLFFTLATLLTALATFTWSFTNTYDYMVANAVFFGVFSGIVIAQRTNVLCHLLGIEKLSSSLGMTVFVQGVGMFAGPLAAGALRDYTGTYVMSYVFLGSCTSLSALFLLITVILRARNRQHFTINS